MRSKRRARFQPHRYNKSSRSSGRSVLARLDAFVFKTEPKLRRASSGW